MPSSAVLEAPVPPRRAHLSEATAYDELIHLLREERAAMDQKSLVISRLSEEHLNALEQLKNMRELAEKFMEAADEKEEQVSQLQHALLQKDCRIAELELDKARW